MRSAAVWIANAISTPVRWELQLKTKHFGKNSTAYRRCSSIRHTEHGVAAVDIIVGNTVLFGATGGLLFASGRAAERFAVRNSGALAVVEGVGDHACEYMTNGQVFVLGMTGKNFGAGMTGGKAYVFDTDDSFSKRYNSETVRIHRVTEESDVAHIQSHVSYHLELTDSQRAREILNGWSDYRYLFWKVVPKTTPGP